MKAPDLDLVFKADVSALVPYRPDGGQRDVLRDFVHSRFVEKMVAAQIDIEIVYADDDHDDPDLFNHGQAINKAYERSHGGVILVMDADTTFDDGDALVLALRSTAADRHWRLPEFYFQLTDDATTRALDRGKYADDEFFLTCFDYGEGEDCEWVGYRQAWSGLVIVPREAFCAVHGAEERYVGHGADDAALGLTLNLLWGKHVRYHGAAVHLWHPRGPQERSAHNPEISRRYEAAAEDVEAMRALVAEKRPLT